VVRPSSDGPCLPLAPRGTVRRIRAFGVFRCLRPILSLPPPSRASPSLSHRIFGRTLSHSGGRTPLLHRRRVLPLFLILFPAPFWALAGLSGRPGFLAGPPAGLSLPCYALTTLPSRSPPSPWVFRVALPPLLARLPPLFSGAAALLCASYLSSPAGSASGVISFGLCPGGLLVPWRPLLGPVVVRSCPLPALLLSPALPACGGRSCAVALPHLPNLPVAPGWPLPALLRAWLFLRWPTPPLCPRFPHFRGRPAVPINSTLSPPGLPLRPLSFAPCPCSSSGFAFRFFPGFGAPWQALPPGAPGFGVASALLPVNLLARLWTFRPPRAVSLARRRWRFRWGPRLAGLAVRAGACGLAAVLATSRLSLIRFHHGFSPPPSPHLPFFYILPCPSTRLRSSAASPPGLRPRLIPLPPTPPVPPLVPSVRPSWVGAPPRPFPAAFPCPSFTNWRWLGRPSPPPPIRLGVPAPRGLGPPSDDRFTPHSLSLSGSAPRSFRRHLTPGRPQLLRRAWLLVFSPPRPVMCFHATALFRLTGCFHAVLAAAAPCWPWAFIPALHPLLAQSFTPRPLFSSPPPAPPQSPLPALGGFCSCSLPVRLLRAPRRQGRFFWFPRLPRL